MQYALQKIAEEKIQEALRNGELDDLPGKGKPIDLSDYFSAPPHLRVPYHILKNSGFYPPEVDLLREIHELAENRPSSANPNVIKRWRQRINQKRTQLHILMENSTILSSSK